MLRRHAAGFFEGLIEGESDRQRPYRMRFGRGEYRYFAYPLPSPVADLRAALEAVVGRLADLSAARDVARTPRRRPAPPSPWP